MQQPADRPFYRHLGIEVLEAAGGRSRVRLPANPALGNSRGDVHGGAIGGLLDIAMSTAARSSLAEDAGATTIQFATHFLATGRGDLLAEANVTRAGKTIVTVEGRVTDTAGALVAQALGSWRVITRR